MGTASLTSMTRACHKFNTKVEAAVEGWSKARLITDSDTGRSAGDLTVGPPAPHDRR